MIRSRHSMLFEWLGLLAYLYVSGTAVSADVRLPHVLGSHMVLQRDRAVTVWGWAEPGEAITVTIGDREVSTRTDANGKWLVKLPAMAAGGPYEMLVRGESTIRLTDILVGEVWLCSGQSNMQWGVATAENGKEEMAAADYPRIRLLDVPLVSSGQPVADVEATWVRCSPETIARGSRGGFSAVAYFFGQELHRELGVPVGLMKAAWGGTRIEPWTPPAGFAPIPKLRKIVEDVERLKRQYRQALPATLDAIDEWSAATRKALARGDAGLPEMPSWPRHPLDSSTQPTGLYNGMIHPLVPLAIRGVIWYQGEANVYAGDGIIYRDKMQALISGWREAWGQGDFPFYYVQLAPFNYARDRDIKPHQLPAIWEAQAAALSIPNTGMVVTTDIGDLQRIHPKKKKQVGKRLALWALAKTYGREDLVYFGPLYKSMTTEDGRIRIGFEHVGGGLASRDGKPLTWFEIAGADRRFVEAQARIVGDTVEVWSEQVARPVAVRFGWDMTAQPNLMNKEGLPAAPFRTDQR